MLDLYSMSADPNPGDIIRVEEVLATTGLCRTMLYKLIGDGTFPCQVALGARSVGWYKNQVIEWKRNRPVKQTKQKGVLEDTGKKRDHTLGALGMLLVPLPKARRAKPRILQQMHSMPVSTRRQM
jgi:prophage regulatory protein